MPSKLFLACFILFQINLFAQSDEDPNLILITLDGYRWQELFNGADSSLMSNKEIVHDSDEINSLFWDKNPEKRREKLTPFIWNNVSKIGQIYGNRNFGNNFNLTNKMKFSYPGYNEILCGFADDERVNNNSKINNPNKTFLEIANQTKAYKNNVFAFCSWDVFPYIINEERSGVPVNAGFENSRDDDLSIKEKYLNQLQNELPKIWESVRYDALTFGFAIEKMKKAHPKIMYISFGETDDFAHDGRYDLYLKSANKNDALIEKLYNFTQSDPFYKNNTIFLITTDHGRGEKDWKDHGKKVNGAEDTWFIIFGKGIKPLGERKDKTQLYTNQIAPTILNFLNIPLPNYLSKGKIIQNLN